MENLLGQSKYTVQTPLYQGPMDLLLSLIERAELDITTISLAMVTEQYLLYIHNLENARADELSSFLVIAAKLLQIKSEALLPRPPEREPGEEDVGTDLVAQLKLYKRYKQVAVWMEDRETLGFHTYLRVAPPPKVEAKLDLSSLTLDGLVIAAESAFRKGMEKQPLGAMIAQPRVTIREKIDLISRTLRHVQRSTFRGLIANKATRVEIVVTFLALLELIKRYHVVAHQEGLFGDIEFEKLGEWKDDEDIDIEFE